jgi:hypothetical protein
MLLIIGGLSGAGKSSLGRHLEQHHAFHWLELDCHPKDMPKEHGIRDEWDELFEHADPSSLLARLPNNTVLTVPSPAVFHNVSKLPRWREIRIRYLTGPKERCFARANARDPILVTHDHWKRNNNGLLTYLESAACPVDWKVEVFDEAGEPKTLEQLALVVIAS